MAGVCLTNQNGNWAPDHYCPNSANESGHFDCKVSNCLWGENKFTDAESCGNKECAKIGLTVNTHNGACECAKAGTNSKNLVAKDADYLTRGYLCLCMGEEGCVNSDEPTKIVQKGDYGGAMKV